MALDIPTLLKWVQDQPKAAPQWFISPVIPHHLATTHFTVGS